MSLESDFYAWFLRELLATLDPADGTRAERHTTEAPRVDGQASRGVGGPVVTPRQSNLLPRPGRAVTVRSDVDGWTALGDTPRHRTLVFEDDGFALPQVWPHLIPCPPLPVVLPTCGVRLDEDDTVLPSYPLLPASDGYIDAGYPRATAYPNPEGAFVEPTGVRLQGGHPRSDEEGHPRMEHLAHSWRPNLRLPYAGGWADGQPYVRYVVLPMGTCRVYEGGSIG